jgi:uncharacterized protein
VAFRPLRRLSARWRPYEGVGLQHVAIVPGDGGFTANALVIGGGDRVPHAFRFTIKCDAQWVTRGLDIESLDGRSVRLRSDGLGLWRNIDGRRLAEFDGCIDVDLDGSPFTNTLPIRRLGLTPRMGRLELAVLYIPLTTLRPFVDRQIYRCIAAGKRYFYEAADGSFAAEISVDRDGLVVDYPPLFHRVPLE